ncbi:hypothetical protein BC828DRAFT_58205 [Blastocladiella britannica]|nr:hypothetical protein BC828DRAFT_58205 [Blastocladiella britannica]
MLLALCRASVAPNAPRFPFLASLVPRLETVHATLVHSAERSLRAQLGAFRSTGQTDASALGSLVRTHLHLDAWSNLIVVLITTMVDPELMSAREAAGPKRHMPTYLGAVQRSLLAERGPLAFVAAVSAVAPQGQSLALRHHILLRLVEALETGAGPATFSAAVPSAFHRNYTAATSFFRDTLAALALTKHAAEIPEVGDLMRKWPIETYFQLVARQLVADFETAPTSSAAVAAAFARLHADYLPALVHRFFKLAAQIVMRYHQALGAVTVTTADEAIDCIVGLAAAQTAVRQSPFFSLHPTIAIGLVPLLGSGARAVHVPCIAALRTDLSESAISALRMTRTIAAQYRATGRPAPTAESSFIAGTFEAATALIASEPARDIPVEVWRAVMPEIAKRTVDAHRDLVQDLLQTLAKTEDSLRRLKQSKGRASSVGASSSAASSAGGSMSDEDKVRLQLALDARALEERVGELLLIIDQDREDQEDQEDQEEGKGPGFAQSLMSPTWVILKNLGNVERPN